MKDGRRKTEDGRVDLAIDGAVREMLDAEPRADLTARVMERLPASSSRLPAFGFRLPTAGWVLGSVAAAAVILIAAFVARRAEPIAPQPTVLARSTDTRLPGPPVAAHPQPAVPPSPVRTQPRHVVRVPEPIVAAASFDDDGAPMAPLKSIAPIAVAPIAESSIAPADIAVRPLSPITEVQIAPLTPPDRR